MILVREVDERLDLETIIADHLRDSRYRRNELFRFPDLLRQSIYSRQAGLRRPQRRGVPLCLSNASPDQIADTMGQKCSSGIDAAPEQGPTPDPTETGS